MAANFNNSAWFYDRLSGLVYGDALIEAQVWLLSYVPANAHVLIVGGGTGWILEELAKLYPTGLTITYVEVAAAMMAKSKKRNVLKNGVTYINEAIENIEFIYLFDVVITPFLFDNFTEDTLSKVFAGIHQYLKPEGLWLNTDFQLTDKWWQRLLLKIMFLFFRTICNIEASRLPAIESRFAENGYFRTTEKTFYGNFIISKVLVKSVQSRK